jgi:hypothetical protein
MSDDISADLKKGCCGGRNREEGSQGLEALGLKALLDTGLTVPESCCSGGPNREESS